MANGIKFSSIEEGALRIGNANIAVRQNSVSNPSSYWTSIEPVNGGYTIYIDKLENGPAVYNANSDAELIALGNKLSGQTFSNINDCLAWFNTYEEGNRNLIPNSRTIINNQISTSYTSNGAILSIDSVNTYQGLSTLKVDGYAGVMLNYQPKSIIEPNTIYTVSMMAKGNNTINGGLSTPLHIQIPAGGHTYETLITSDSSITTDWKQIWVTFKSNVAFNTNINIFLYSIGSVICNIAWTKLEKGSVATPWRPAMEDPDYVLDKFVLSSEIPPIVTNGLVLNYDAGLIPSYPRGGTVIIDVSGNGNNGRLVNGVGYSSEGGGSLVFDGVNDLITRNPINVGNVFTYNFWIKPTTKTRQCVCSNSYTWGSNKGFLIDCPGNSSTEIFISLGKDQKGAGSKTAIISNKWQMVTCRVNGIAELIKIYINGIEVSTYNWQTDANIQLEYDVGNLLIGYWANMDFFNSNLGQVMLYNRALTQQEILQNYYAGLQKFIPKDGLVLSLSPQNSYFSGSAITSVRDISGYSNDANVYNGVAYVREGGGSWSFDGVDDSVFTSSIDLSNTNQCSISFWFKTNKLSGVMILGEFSSNFNSFNGAIAIYMNESGSGIIDYGNHTSLGYNIIKTTKSYNDNKWHHIVCTNDKLLGAAQNKMYVDGELDYVQHTSFTYITTGNFGNFPLYIGSRGNNSLFYSGNISDFKLYNRALTTTEISTIYQASKSKYI